MANKKLIEVALPLEKINAESAREKSIRHGHPSTLHLWWARRPLATARAVIWSSLVDDPSSHPEKFPTEEAQNAERQRLFKILEELVVWENSNDEKVLNAAKAEIMKSTGNNPPALLDPFAGGGAIPLEAQRLGLEAHAHDLNPVAVMINKAMIEIPPKFAGMSPVNPDARRQGSANVGYKGAAGLAEDVRYYGEWMKQEAFKRIGHLYPKVKVPAAQGGGEATVIAWIWARTVKCPNPACGCHAPLVSSFELSKRKGKEAHIHPIINQQTHEIDYEVCCNNHDIPQSPKAGHGSVFRCVACGQLISDSYIKEEALKNRMVPAMTAVIAEKKGGRLYITPDYDQITTAKVQAPDELPTGTLANDTRALWCTIYGLDEFNKLYTNRQLSAMTCFSDLVHEVKIKAEQDAIRAGMKNDHLSMEKGGNGALAYSEAVSVYLALVVDKCSNYWSSMCSWRADHEAIRETYSMHAILMTWDYAEINPFSNSAGNFSSFVEKTVETLSTLGNCDIHGVVEQKDAQTDCGLRNIIVATDPPYYDNIGYADLSDYFYVWLRRSIQDIYPSLFSTMLVPKKEELVASAYRFSGGADEAKVFFEEGMNKACAQIYKYTSEDIPVTIYYAFKQSDTISENGKQKTASSGWETMLSAIINNQLVITGTWPLRTELATRSRAQGSNALASSIVLVCRKRPENAQQTTKKRFFTEKRG